LIDDDDDDDDVIMDVVLIDGDNDIADDDVVLGDDVGDVVLGDDVRASPVVLSMFFTSKFSYVLFCNPTNKSETGTANRWGTTNNKPPGPIIMMGQSETLSTR
jgi:hypothetical protein